jgi:hypothetical protein
MNVKIYDIDYAKLAGWITPQELRKNKLRRVINILAGPVIVLYQLLLVYRNTKLYQLKISPQKCYLRQLLNNRYDFTLRRIYIDDGQDKPPFFIFQHPELKPKYLRRKSENVPVRIYTSGESGTIADDFIVFVPMTLAFEEPEMISLVKVYKLAGTKFKIQRV